MKNFTRLLAGEPPLIRGDGRQTLDYIYVDDVVTLTIEAMVRPLSDRVINICSGQPVDIIELTEIMRSVAGSDHMPVHDEPDSTHASQRVGDPALMDRLLGRKARVPLKEGLARTYEWMKSERIGA